MPVRGYSRLYSAYVIENDYMEDLMGGAGSS